MEKFRITTDLIFDDEMTEDKLVKMLKIAAHRTKKFAELIQDKDELDEENLSYLQVNLDEKGWYTQVQENDLWLVSEEDTRAREDKD